MILFSSDHKEIFLAFCKAQREFPKIPMSGYNPHFKSSYSTYDDIKDACFPVLSKYGIAVWQPPAIKETSLENQFVIVTMLIHGESGQWMQSMIPITPDKGGAQPMGGFISYARRYSLGSTLGVSGSEDDDGNSSSVNSNQSVHTISQEQFDILKNEIKSKPDPSKVHKDILGFNKIDKLEDLPFSSFRSVKSYLDKVNTSKT